MKMIDRKTNRNGVAVDVQMDGAVKRALGAKR